MQNRHQLAQLAAALEGIPVWGCLPGSQAQRLGMRYGDVILSVNGKRTQRAEEYVEARQLRADSAEVVVFRDGRELTIEIPCDLECRPVTRAQIREAAHQVAAARLMPSQHPPFKRGDSDA